MKAFKKIKRIISLNKDFFVKSQKYSASSKNLNGRRFWIYAESLGELRLALYIINIIKSILSEKKEQVPVFFVSFKTLSTDSLIQNLLKKNENGGILYFFHPFFGLKRVFRKYASIIKPNYFISVQHSVSKKLVNELLNFNSKTKLIFAGITAAELKKIGVKANLPEIYAASSLSAIISGYSGADALKIDVMPTSLKYISCTEGVAAGQGEDYSGEGLKKIVISFASVHKKEASFILNLLREIILNENISRKFNLKFIFIPRNIKNSRPLFKKSFKMGFNPIYCNEEEENGKLNDFLSSDKHKTLILGKYGVMDKIYPVSDIVYVGKSLFKSEKGGHNVLEPASYGKAIVTGSYAVNFKEIIDEMIQYHAINSVDEINFKGVLINLIEDAASRNETGQNGLNFCIKKRDEFKTYFKNYLTEIIV